VYQLMEVGAEGVVGMMCGCYSVSVYSTVCGLANFWGYSTYAPVRAKVMSYLYLPFGDW
jgi:hypothetical protein